MPQISGGKFNRFRRATAGFTTNELDGYRLRVHLPARPHRRPPIRFLFIGSRLCSALLSGPASRRVLFHPCASLSLHVHHVVKVAVGIPVSWYPPHGSVRALLSAYGSYRG